MTTKTVDPPGGEVLVYEAPDGGARVEVRLDHETVWLTQDQMSQLFGRERSVITKHIRNVFREGELEAKAVCANFAHTADDGKTYQVDHYNLDVIISVGYRVKSTQGTRFRQWATRVLREHLVRGYTFDRRRLAERGLDEARQVSSISTVPSRRLRLDALSSRPVVCAHRGASSRPANPTSSGLCRSRGQTPGL